MIWGAFAMLTSAPFDDWWHNAYGLDVKILSPPHCLLAAGMIGIQLGAMLLAVALQNRVPDAAGSRLAPVFALLFAYTSGVLLVLVATMLMEYSDPNLQHGALFYQASCGVYPLFLVAASRASRMRWGATAAAGVYTALKLAVLWILPLFPARPLLAPIYNPVDHMWPTTFPLLLLLPAVAIDLVPRLLPRAGGWTRAVVAAAAFLARRSSSPASPRSRSASPSPGRRRSPPSPSSGTPAPAARRRRTPPPACPATPICGVPISG